MEIQNNPHLDRSFRIAILLAFAAMAGQLFYGVVIEVLLASWSAARPNVVAEYPLLKPLFYVGAITLLLVAGRVRDHLLGQGAPLQQMVGQLLDPAQRQQRMVKASQVGMVIAGASGVLALLLFALGGDRLDCYPLIAVALVGQARLVPNRRTWEQWYAQRNTFR